MRQLLSRVRKLSPRQNQVRKRPIRALSHFWLEKEALVRTSSGSEEAAFPMVMPVLSGFAATQPVDERTDNREEHTDGPGEPWIPALFIGGLFAQYHPVDPYHQRTDIPDHVELRLAHQDPEKKPKLRQQTGHAIDRQPPVHSRTSPVHPCRSKLSATRSSEPTTLTPH